LPAISPLSGVEIINLADERLLNRWHPIARSKDLVPGHVFHARLLGEELAVWRDSEGRVNVWENRCPHRGLRLTLGHNLGTMLKCQYHGLRYAAGSGSCVSIPSNPAGEPISRRMCAQTFPAREGYGLVWASVGEARGAPSAEGLDSAESTTLRGIVVHAAAELVAESLKDYSALLKRDHESEASAGRLIRTDLLTLMFGYEAGGRKGVLALIVQPADKSKSIIHGVISGGLDAASHRATLRRHNDLLCELRDRIEAREGTRP
jgi:nitrite reductase/ring-hydroxylating ferredoxin subunit